jgi:TetR/AcrR family transcriptional regulator, cholesterol catabolism regulator
VIRPPSIYRSEGWGFESSQHAEQSPPKTALTARPRFPQHKSERLTPRKSTPVDFATSYRAGSVGRAEDNKRDKQQRIARAARELFGVRGFDGTTMEAVAAAAGVSKGALFFHVRSKAALLHVVFEADMREWIDDAFRERPSTNALDELVDIYGTLLAAVCAQPDLALVYMRQVGFADDDHERVDQAMDLVFGRTAAVLERAKHHGELRSDVNSRQLAYNLFALYFVEQHLWLSDRATDPAEMDARLRPVFALHLVGLLRPGAARDRARDAGTSKRVSSAPAIGTGIRAGSHLRSPWLC